MKLTILPLCVALLCGCTLSHSSSFANKTNTTEDKPNFLWLTFEDTSWDELGCYGNSSVNTPIMDKLAAEGTRYTRAWSTAPQCSTARSSLITGCYGTTYNMDNHRHRYLQPEDIPLYPKVLREAGYYCMNVTKADYNIQGISDGQGLWDEQVDLDRLRDRPFFAVYNNGTSHMSRVIRAGIGEMDEEMIMKGLDPDTLKLPPHVPESPAMRKDLVYHLATVQSVDAWVKRHLDDLKSAGLHEDTIVFVYSDHGGCLPRGKGWAYETGLRVPFIVYVPPKWQEKLGVKPGTVSDELVSFIDFAPTVFSIAGIDIPESMQGRPFLGDRKAESRPYQFGFSSNGYEIYRPMRTVSDGTYKYIRNYIPHRPDCLRNDFQWRMKGNLAWDDYLFNEGGSDPVWTAAGRVIKGERLFDIEKDPYETRDLSMDPNFALKLDELRGAMSRHLRDTRDLGLFPAMCRDRGNLSLYEWVRKTDYDLEALYQAAELASVATEKDVPRLQELLSSDRPELRYWGAVGFGTLGANRVKVSAPEEQLNCMNDSNAEVATTAAETVALLGGAGALETLVRISDEEIDEKNPDQFLSQGHNAAKLAMGSLEMLSTYEHTKPLVARYLDEYWSDPRPKELPYDVRVLQVNLGKAPAKILLNDK